MAPPFERPLVSPVLVGRDAQVAAIERALDEVAGGAGRTVVIAGEAGLGKSRLVAEARVQANRRGFLVLEGACFEPDRALPYAPFLDLLRAHVTDFTPDELAAELGPTGPELVKLLPELAAVVPGLAPTPSLDPEQERRRLIHALVRFFAGLAASRSLLLVVEDLHWCDEASFDLLLQLARRIAASPILLLFTYRSDERHPDLTRFLAQLDRGRLATEVPLRPLDLAELDAMLRAIFGLDRPPRAVFVHALHGLTEGNPFFAEEVLRSLVATGDLFYGAGGWERKPLDRLRVPRGIEDAVRRRVDRLSEAAREVLALAAVAGRRFDFALLQQLTGREEADLLPLLKELIAAQLIVEVSADQFAFRHALTRQAVYGSLLARERRALHGRVAAALARGDRASGDAHLEDLAYHHAEAEVWDKALGYARRAGERAQALYATHAAIEHFGRAIAAAAHVPDATAAALHRARGQAYDALGDFDAARADFETALELADAAGDGLMASQTLLDLGLLWSSRDADRAHAHLVRALDLARALGDPAALANALNRMGNWLANHEEPEAALRHHEEALAIVDELGDRPGVAATLDMIGMAKQLGGDVVGAMPPTRRAMSLFRELGDRQGVVNSLALSTIPGAIYEVETVAGGGTIAEAIVAGEQALAIAREIGWRSGEAFAMAVLGEGYGAAGEFGRALELLRGAIAIAEEIGHREWMIQSGWGLGRLHENLFAPTAAREHLERALELAQAMRSPLWTTIVAGGLASTHVAQGELAQADALLTAHLQPATPMRTQGQRLLWCARAELTLTRGEPEDALAILDRLYATAPHGADGGAIPRLARLKAAALTALGQPGPAEALLVAAQATARAEGALPTLRGLHAALASIYREQRRPAEAEREAAAARRLVDHLAASLPDGELRDRFVHCAIADLSIPTGRTARDAAKEAAGGLTRRELEVAARIGAGRTNRQIAGELFVSERTVETHVASILRRLGFASRTQIASWATERGLVRPDT